MPGGYTAGYVSLFEGVSFGGYYGQHWKLRCLDEQLGSGDYLSEPNFGLYPYGHYGDNNNVWNQITSGPYYVAKARAKSGGGWHGLITEGNEYKAPFHAEGRVGTAISSDIEVADEDWYSPKPNNNFPTGSFRATQNSYMKANFAAESGVTLGDGHDIFRATNSRPGGQAYNNNWRGQTSHMIGTSWSSHSQPGHPTSAEWSSGEKAVSTPASHLNNHRYFNNGGTHLNPHNGIGFQTYEVSAWIKGASSNWGTTQSTAAAGGYSIAGTDNMTEETDTSNRYVALGAGAQFDLWLFTHDDTMGSSYSGGPEWFPTRTNYNGEHYNAALNSTHRRMSVRVQGTATTTWTYYSTAITIYNGEVGSPTNDSAKGDRRCGYISTRLDINNYATSETISSKSGNAYTRYTYPVIYMAGWSVRPLNCSMARDVEDVRVGGGTAYGQHFYNAALAGKGNVSLKSGLVSKDIITNYTNEAGPYT